MLNKAPDLFVWASSSPGRQNYSDMICVEKLERKGGEFLYW